MRVNRIHKTGLIQGCVLLVLITACGGTPNPPNVTSSVQMAPTAILEQKVSKPTVPDALPSMASPRGVYRKPGPMFTPTPSSDRNVPLSTATEDHRIAPATWVGIENMVMSDFELPDSSGSTVSLSNVLSKNHFAVLVFYRGHF